MRKELFCLVGVAACDLQRGVTCRGGMKRSFPTIVIVALFWCLRLSSADAGEYPANKVEIVELKTTGRELLLAYVTELESLYFSPGINVEEGRRPVVLHIMKCSIYLKCRTDFPAEILKGGGSARVLLRNEFSVEDVYIEAVSEKNRIKVRSE